MIPVIPLLLVPALFCNEDESARGQQWGKLVKKLWFSKDLQRIKNWQVHGSQFLGSAKHLCVRLVLPAPVLSFAPSGESRKLLHWNPGHGAEIKKLWPTREKGQIASYFLLEAHPKACVTGKSHKKACGLSQLQWLTAAPTFCSLCGLKCNPLFYRTTDTDTFLPSELQLPTRVDQVGCIWQQSYRRKDK